MKSLQKLILRESVKTNYSIVYSLNKIISFTDLPINFDQINKYWWRWYSDIFGFYYHRVKRSYSVWLTTYLKKNIGIYMPFFFKAPLSRKGIVNNWRRRAFLYEKTLSKKIGIHNKNLSLNFWSINYNKLSASAKDILLTGNREHRQVGSYGIFGLELNMFVSSYNAKWNNLYKPEYLFFNSGKMPSDFLLVINSFFISSSFFINSYDSQLILYSQYFLEYYNKIYCGKIQKIISFFIIKNDIIFYNNILLLLNLLYYEFIYIKFFKYIDLFILKNINFIIYKFNLYLYFLRYINFYFKKMCNRNNYYIYVMFINIFNFNKLTAINKINNITKNNIGNFIQSIYFSNYITLKNNWLNKKSNNIFKFYLKYLNKFYLKNILNKHNIRKLYVTEWVYFWEILKEHNNDFKDIKKDKQSLYFKNKYISLLKYKYEKLKDLYSIIEYLNNLKIKYMTFNNNFNYLIINPSMKSTKTGLLTKLIKVTYFGKHYTTIPYQFQNAKDISFFFTNNLNKFRFLSYIKYTKIFLQKIQNFLIKFSSILINNLKINFGFSYTLFNKFDFFYNNYFFYNILSSIYIYFSFIRQYFKTKNNMFKFKNSFNIKNSNIFDKKFFFIINITIKKYKKFLSYRNFFTSKYKGINLNNLGYLKFINKF